MNNTSSQKASLVPMTIHLRPQDVSLGRQLEALTGVSFRVHIRSAVAQYLRAHQTTFDSVNPLNFELEGTAPGDSS